MRIQPRIPGIIRRASFAALLPQLDRCIKQDAARFGGSSSWVIVTALIEHYAAQGRIDPDIQEAINTNAPRRRRPRKTARLLNLIRKAS
jgi:hypothetical protein